MWAVSNMPTCKPLLSLQMSRIAGSMCERGPGFKPLDTETEFTSLRLMSSWPFVIPSCTFVSGHLSCQVCTFSRWCVESSQIIQSSTTTSVTRRANLKRRGDPATLSHAPQREISLIDKISFDLFLDVFVPFLLHACFFF